MHSTTKGAQRATGTSEKGQLSRLSAKRALGRLVLPLRRAGPGSAVLPQPHPGGCLGSASRTKMALSYFGLAQGAPPAAQGPAQRRLHRQPEERHLKFSVFLTCCICNKRVQNDTNPLNQQRSLCPEPSVRPRVPEAVRPPSPAQTLGQGTGPSARDKAPCFRGLPA